MKIVRSVLGVVLGFVVALALIAGAQTLSAVLNPLGEGQSFADLRKAFEECSPAAKEYMQSLPLISMTLLQLASPVAGFFGGAVSAWIAGRAHLIHAWIIGALILALTIVNLANLRNMLGYVHPPWLLIIALLLPMPLAMLGGVLVKRLTFSEASSSQAGQG